MADNRYIRARELAGLSVGQAARLLGVSVADLAHVEQRQEPRDTITTARLAEMYGCSITWLVGEAPRLDYAAVDRIAGGRDLPFRDRDMLAELFAMLPRSGS